MRKSIIGHEHHPIRRLLASRMGFPVGTGSALAVGMMIDVPTPGRLVRRDIVHVQDLLNNIVNLAEHENAHLFLPLDFAATFGSQMRICNSRGCRPGSSTRTIFRGRSSASFGAARLACGTCLRGFHPLAGN
jgi:hypothetical protein